MVLIILVCWETPTIDKEPKKLCYVKKGLSLNDEKEEVYYEQEEQ